MQELRVETFDRMTLLGRRYWFAGVNPGNNEIEFPSQTYKDKRQRDKTAIKLAVKFGTMPIERKGR